ncbi:MAG: hypothetical protein OXJ52_08855, partial [Oligoflexia bacterium]|nr:hypothetical protein [Oligoflexia bacterium]
KTSKKQAGRKKSSTKKASSIKRSVKKQINKKIDSAFNITDIESSHNINQIEEPNRNKADDFDVELEKDIEFIEKDLGANDIAEDPLKELDDSEPEDDNFETFQDNDYSSDEDEEEAVEMNFDDPFDSIEDLDDEEEDEGDLF